MLIASGAAIARYAVSTTPNFALGPRTHHRSLEPAGRGYAGYVIVRLQDKVVLRRRQIGGFDTGYTCTLLDAATLETIEQQQVVPGDTAINWAVDVDVNGDGRLDLLHCSQNGRNIEVHDYERGSSRALPARGSVAPSSAVAVRIADQPHALFARHGTLCLVGPGGIQWQHDLPDTSHVFSIRAHPGEPTVRIDSISQQTGAPTSTTITLTREGPTRVRKSSEYEASAGDVQASTPIAAGLSIDVSNNPTTTELDTGLAVMRIALVRRADGALLDEAFGPIQTTTLPLAGRAATRILPPTDPSDLSTQRILIGAGAQLVLAECTLIDDVDE